MKLSDIETNLYDLLLKKNEEVVISISGEWGVGKTFFWNNLISKKYQTEFKKKKIAYVSLFGIDSLSDIRTSILLQASPTKNKISFINKKVFTPFKNLKSSFSSFPRFRGNAYTNPINQKTPNKTKHKLSKTR